MKKWSRISLFCLLLGCVGVPVLAGTPRTIQKTERYNIRAETGKYERAGLFPEEIAEDGSIYRLVSVEFEPMIDADALDITPVTRTVTYVASEGEIYIPENEWSDGGDIWTLDSCAQQEETVIEAWTEEIEKVVFYDGDIAEEEIPQSIMLQGTETLEGGVLETEGILSEIRESGGQWIEDRILITYYEYDADTYLFRGYSIPHDDGKPALTGYEQDILASAGYDVQEWTVTDISWNGGTYESDGRICRNALAAIRKWQTGYMAVYKGAILHPAEKKVVYTALYKSQEEEMIEGYHDYVVTATAAYQEVQDSVFTPLTMGISIVLLAVLLVLILYILTVKRKEKEKNG